MKINWIIIGIVVVLAIILVVFLIKRNQKDEKNLEEYFNKQHNLEEDESELNKDDEN
jgi:Na+/proline symporter